MGYVVAPTGNLTLGKATHYGVEYAYQSIQKEDKFNGSECIDRSRDYIQHDVETEWDKLSKGEAVDHAVGMTKTYIESDPIHQVHQPDVVGTEMKAGIVVPLDGGDRAIVSGYADIILKDTVIDIKTSASKQKKATGYNYLQNSVYAHHFGYKTSEVHSLSYTKKGTQLNSFGVPIMETQVLAFLIAGFWNKLKENSLVDVEPKEKMKLFSPTGIVHSWACSYCGYGKQGLCPFKLK